MNTNPEIKRVIAELLDTQLDDSTFAAKIEVLNEEAEHRDAGETAPAELVGA